MNDVIINDKLNYEHVDVKIPYDRLIEKQSSLIQMAMKNDKSYPIESIKIKKWNEFIPLTHERKPLNEWREMKYHKDKIFYIVNINRTISVHYNQKEKKYFMNDIFHSCKIVLKLIDEHFIVYECSSLPICYYDLDI